MLSVPLPTARTVDLDGTPALLVPAFDVTPGGGLGLDDRVTSLLMWELRDGSVVQVLSDVLPERHLLDYASSIVLRAG